MILYFSSFGFGGEYFSKSWSCQEHKITECSIHELLGWMHYEYDPRLSIWESTHMHFSCILKALNLPFSMPFFLSWGQEEQVVVFARDPFPFHSLYHICSATSQRLGGFQVFAGLRNCMDLRCLFTSKFSMHKRFSIRAFCLSRNVLYQQGDVAFDWVVDRESYWRWLERAWLPNVFRHHMVSFIRELDLDQDNDLHCFTFICICIHAIDHCPTLYLWSVSKCLKRNQQDTIHIYIESKARIGANLKSVHQTPIRTHGQTYSRRSNKHEQDRESIANQRKRNPEKARKEKKTTANQRKPTKMKEKTMTQPNDKKHPDTEKVKSCMTDYSRREQRSKMRSTTNYRTPQHCFETHTWKEKYDEICRSIVGKPHQGI